jgi:hypothetical protein
MDDDADKADAEVCPRDRAGLGEIASSGGAIAGEVIVDDRRCFARFVGG